MRVLVVGAGIAGLTLAALLDRQGTEVEVVERARPGAEPGYALALWPHGTRVLHALGVHDSFVARSEPMLRYAAEAPGGRVLTSSPLPSSIAEHGHVGLLPRGELIDLLRGAAPHVPVRHGLSIDDVRQDHDRVLVRFTDTSRAGYDLVVGADGINSVVRDTVLGPVPRRDTGWRCLVWWVDRDLTEPGVTVERYGRGSFVGTYPCRDRLCVIAGVPSGVLDGAGSAGSREERLAEILRQYALPPDSYLASLPHGNDRDFVWRMEDVRAPEWVRGRVALVGDAAAAFLPTAGIGASMALESAAVLADELSRTDAHHVPNALHLYERRRRRRVQGAQTQSRRLARVMFLRSSTLSWVRNHALRHARMEQMVSPLVADLRRPI